MGARYLAPFLVRNPAGPCCPRHGGIACGYFVTTTPHDAGLRLQRTVLAKQASETLIKNRTSEAHITRYRGLSRAGFVRQVRALGPGLYVLGLDFHAAFCGCGPAEPRACEVWAVLAPYWPCRWYQGYKQRHLYWWLSFL